MAEIKLRLHLPYECLFDLRWGFIRKYSDLDKFELYNRFGTYCSRTTEDLRTIVPSLSREFTVNPDVVKLAPRTAILTLISNAYRQFYSEHPDDKVTLHLTLDFAVAPFIPKQRRQAIVDTLKGALSESIEKVHVIHQAIGTNNYTIKQLRSKYDGIIVYDLDDFIAHHNINAPQAYNGIGIITRPLFVNGKTGAQFAEYINGLDKRGINDTSGLPAGDHYDILSDVFSHVGSIYFHEPEYFSAISPE